jgi:hypothetical protein
MIRKVALIVGLTVAVHLGLICTPARAVGPLNLLVPGLPGPGDVISIIDHLTKNVSDTTVDVKLGKTICQGKLLIARTKVDVCLERSSKNWRGRVLAHMTVPTEITYSIDLAQIRPEHIRLEPRNRQLILTMPEPKVEDVTPLLPGVKSENTFRACRFKRCDKSTSFELQNAMLLHDFQAKAREVAESSVPKIREQGRVALEQLLQKLLETTAHGIKVVVE